MFGLRKYTNLKNQPIEVTVFGSCSIDVVTIKNHINNYFCSIYMYIFTVSFKQLVLVLQGQYIKI